MNSRIMILVRCFLLSIAAFGCSRSLFVDCNECYTDKPSEAELVISVSINAENPEVPVWLYEGTFDAGTEILADTVRTTSVSFYVPVNKYYSIMAEYKSKGKIIRVVDGKKVTIYKDVESCDSPCWVINGNSLDAKLKF